MGLKELLERAKISQKGNTIEIDLGEAPMEGPATLLFPTGTTIRIDGKEKETQEGEEFTAGTWCSGMDMTWGYLSLPNKPYFKALNYPQEVTELIILEDSGKK